MKKEELEALKDIFEKSLKNEPEINVDDEIDEIFDKEEYKKKLKTDINNYYKSFNNNLKKIVENSLKEKDEILEKDFDLIISKYSNICKRNQVNIKNFILELRDELNEIKENTEGMSEAINELHDLISAKELILQRPEKNGENQPK